MPVSSRVWLPRYLCLLIIRRGLQAPPLVEVFLLKGYGCQRVVLKTPNYFMNLKSKTELHPELYCGIALMVLL